MLKYVSFSLDYFKLCLDVFYCLIKPFMILDVIYLKDKNYIYSYCKTTKATARMLEGLNIALNMSV